MAGAFPLSGDIDPKAFPHLILQLHNGQATGSLKVEGPSYQKALYLRSGRVLFGSSNDPRDQLGAILIEAGKLTPAQLDDVNTKVGPGNPLAKVLTDSGLVTQQELGDAARSKVERILRDMLTYREGSFEFEDGVLPKGAIDLKLSTERLVVNAVRHIEDRAFVLDHMGSLEALLVPVPEKGVPPAEVQTEIGGLLAEIDGQRTLKEAIHRTRLDEFEGAKIACALLFLGYLRHEEPAASTDGVPQDAAFFVAQEPRPELDLGQTARLAFDATQAMPSVPPPAPSATLTSESTSTCCSPAESGFDTTASLRAVRERTPRTTAMNLVTCSIRSSL